MKTPIEPTIFEYKILGSKFIGLLFPCKTILDFENLMEKTKKEYPKATHYCYAYIIGNNKKFSDDGEPNGTAGKPMLNILEKNETTNTLLIIVRYFGGTKLGAGRLERTYALVASSSISQGIYGEYIFGKEVEIELPYSLFDSLKKKMDVMGIDIKEKEFSSLVKLTCLVDDKIIDTFVSSLPYEAKCEIKNNVEFVRRER